MAAILPRPQCVKQHQKVPRLPYKPSQIGLDLSLLVIYVPFFYFNFAIILSFIVWVDRT